MLWDILIIGLVFFIVSPLVQLGIIWLATCYLRATYVPEEDE